MKVALNPTKLIVQKQNTFVQRPQNNQIQQNTKSMELSNFNSIGRSMVSFRGNSQINMDLKSKTIEELEELKSTILGNSEESEKIKKDAQERLDAIETWNYSDEYLKQQNEAENEINRKHLSRFWNPFQCHEIRQKHYDKFSRRNSEIEGYKSHKKQDEDIVRMSPLSAEQTKNFIASIDDMIAQKKQIEEQERRLQGIEGIKSAIESMNNAQGGLDDRIAGYDYEKNEIRNAFITPLAESKMDPTIEVPGSILLYGASGTGKTTFIRSIAQEGKSGEYAHVVDLPATLTSKDLIERIKDELDKAKGRYFEPDETGAPKRIRTILLLDDAEKFFGMPYEQAKAVYKELIDDNDTARLQGRDYNPDVIDTFKALLEKCSLVPANIKDNSQKAATTMFITTNYPHLIDRDLIRKFNKIIPVNPAKNVNLEEVMKHYFKKCSDVLEEVKKAAQNPNFKARDLKFLKDYLNQKSINTLIKMAEEGTLDKLSIDWQNYPYNSLAKLFNPSEEKGAFDNMQLRDFAIEALNSYIAEPNRRYYGHYYNTLFYHDTITNDDGIEKRTRNLDPQRYKHFVDIFNTLAPLNKQEGISEEKQQIIEKQRLLGLEFANMLEEQDKKLLEFIRTQEKQELDYLEFKEKEGTLSEEDKKRLDTVKKSIELDNITINEDEDY